MTMTSSIHTLWNNAKQYVDVGEIMTDLGIKVDHVNGDEYVALCPLHDDGTPSFSINEKKMVYNCFACGGGSLPELVAKIKDISLEEAIQYLARSTSPYEDDLEKFKERVNSHFIISTMKEEVELPSYNFSMVNIFANNVWLKENDDALDYLLSRNLSREVILDYKIGFDPGAFRANAKFGTYTGPAIILPHFFGEDLVGYQQRWVGDDKPVWVPKYTNTGSFPKNFTLWNYDVAVAANMTTIVVESVFTALYLTSMGYTAVATFGAEVTDHQIKLLSNFVNGIITAFDNDDAGHRANGIVTNALKNSIPVYNSDFVGKPKGDLNDLSPDDLSNHLDNNVYPAFMRRMR